jgi:hypothetical protein
MDAELEEIIDDLLDSQDSNGCPEDSTVVSQESIDKLKSYMDKYNA